MQERTPNRGIVRPSKRPEGWVAPGPKPVGPGDREDLWPALDEDLCHLSGEWRILQKLKGHRSSLDDLATAWYATQHAPPTVERAVDLGCGIGSVLMMVAWNWPTASVTGVEAQDISVGLARRSLDYNGASTRCVVRHGDLRDPSMLPEGGVFDLVTGTPPYIPLGKGIISDKVQCEPCRFEVRGGIEAYCDAAARALAPHGRFVVCEGANPVERTRDAAHAAGLRVFAWRHVVGREGKPPLFSLYAMELGSDSLPTLPEPEAPLVIRDRSGYRTPECARMREAMGMPP